jgi:6-phosphogluconolactonase/glucosamine-6-phosphate isomerase/deaminase
MASGSKKAAIMVRVMREPGGEHLPASIVHRISAAQVMADRDAFPL